MSFAKSLLSCDSAEVSLSTRAGNQSLGSGPDDDDDDVFRLFFTLSWLENDQI